MRLPVLLGVLLVLAGCVPSSASPPPAAVPPAPRSPLASLFAPVRSYHVGTRRPGGEGCSTEAAVTRYVESLEFVDLPPVVFGLDEAGCILEMRMNYADGSGRFAHAVAFVTQRLGAPTGEDRAVCPTTGEAVQCVYWVTPEGRFEVVRAGLAASPEFVLRSSEAPFTYDRLCEGGVVRD